LAQGASAEPIYHCTGTSWIWSTLTTNKTTKPVLTHNHGLHLAPGSSASKTVTLEHSTTVTASASSTIDASASFGTKLIGEVSAELSVTLAASGSSTTTKSESTTQSFDARSKDSYYAVYDGVVRYNGTWNMMKCVSGIGRTYSGPWQSYVGVSASNALCMYGTTTRKSSYTPGSLSYLACEAIDWGRSI
jgi:hypothetical protein